MAVDERDARPPGSTRSRSRSRREVSRGRKIWARGVAEAARDRDLPRVLAVPDLDRVEAARSRSRRPPTTFSALFDNWSVISEAMWTTLRRGRPGLRASRIVIGGVDRRARWRASRCCAPRSGR